MLKFYYKYLIISLTIFDLKLKSIEMMCIKAVRKISELQKLQICF